MPSASSQASSNAASHAETAPSARTAKASPRFNPGDTLAGRYRIVGFLGRGGMGEVYRADDLELAQSVAIKLLPSRIAADPNLTERVRAEVRLARGISHKNVCRIHDIARLPADQGGDLFISMEYIDGEDLQTLLQRIGKLPQDKAIDVARQLCAALAAAHDQGVIHRDLKPANVMLDGRGNARLTDFGIAAVDDELDTAAAYAGTPAYMAPEQFAGESVSKQSDIYALGLVIFELLTGKPAWKAESYAELKTLRQAGTTPTNITSISSAGIDPALAALVERCTETDPADRPTSAMAVAAALPGADPIAAAIAAGETPSPELIAASGGKGALRPITAAVLALTTVALTALAVVLSRGTTLLTVAPPPAAPALMQEAALNILADLGHAQPNEAPVQTGWAISEITLDRVTQAIAEGDADSWSALGDPFADPVRYWFRIEPDGFDPYDPAFTISVDDPPRTSPGSILVILDGDRNLVQLRIVPTDRINRSTQTPTTEPDWSAAFAAAGLDINDFESIDEVRRDRADADIRLGWRGTSRASNDTTDRGTAASRPTNFPAPELEVFAGAADGKIVEFAISYPQPKQATTPSPPTSPEAQASSETDPADLDPTDPDLAAPGRTDAEPHTSTGPPYVNPNSAAVRIIAGIAQTIVILTITLVAGIMAYRNYRLGRCDLRRASRLGLTVFALSTLAAVINADILPFTLQAFLGTFPIYAIGLASSLILVACYIAVEPLARSRWPGSLVSWTRFFGGNFTDPMIGRDVLIGVAVGAVTIALSAAGDFAALQIGRDVSPPTAAATVFALDGPSAMLAQCISQVAVGFINSAAIALLVLVVMLLLGLIKVTRRWPAIVVVLVLVAGQTLATPNVGPLDRLTLLSGVTLIIILLDRVGLLATAAALAAAQLLTFFVYAAPYDQWWAAAAFTPAVLVAVALLYAYRTSTAGKSLFAPNAPTSTAR
ncbi:MAG: serine/threonine-protein kinase [Planctomycetota bacterium]